MINARDAWLEVLAVEDEAIGHELKHDASSGNPAKSRVRLSLRAWRASISPTALIEARQAWPELGASSAGTTASSAESATVLDVLERWLEVLGVEAAAALGAGVLGAEIEGTVAAALVVL